MNALHAAGRDSATAADPLASVRIDATAIADLAFGSFSRAMLTDEGGAGRHLALLDTQSLALDLSDPAQRRFGNYELVELIGEGGMGAVYRARQASLDRDVAVKLLAAGPWASKSFIERFQREAQNSARMQHPNIVAIYEVDSSEGLHFFSMRLIRGGSLADLLDREHKLPALRAAQLLRTIAEAVDYAHRLGVLHLDLKPANVLLDENGAPHVADFGLARRMEQGLAADNNEISGTPSYMAPEQATAGAQKITPATDVWGLGAIFYELVAGRPPFIGATPQATLKLLVAGRLTNPRDLVPDLPRDLAAIIEKCMAYNVADRYASARALADDLGRFIENRAVQARPLNTAQRTARWAKRQPYVAAFAGLLALSLSIGIAGVTAQWKRAEGNARAATASTILANERLWQSRLDQAATAIRDGRPYDALPGLAANIKEREALALDAHEDRIRIGTVERSAPRLIDVIALGSGISGVAISPDGASVAVSAMDETVRLFDAATGTQRSLRSMANTSHFWPKIGGGELRLALLKFTPDGRRLIGRYAVPKLGIVMPSGMDDVLFDASNGAALLPPANRYADFRDATYSSDGAYAVLRSEDQHAMLVRTDGWQPVSTRYAFDKGNPAWLVPRGGRHVLTSGMQNLNIHDPATLEIRRSIAYDASQRITAWTSSPDGTSVLIGRLDGQIERIDLISGQRERIWPTPIGRVGWIEYSDDGRWFGAVADSGDVLVWETASGRLAAPAMHLSVVSNNVHHDQISLNSATHTLIASSDVEMAMWYLPGADTAPVRLSGEFPNTGAYWTRAFAYDAARGLIATDGGRGELQLWRTPRLASTGLRAVPLPSTELHADDGRIVTVDGNALMVSAASDASALSPRMELPQAPSFAQLSRDGASLIATAGSTLFVYDTQKWTLRRPPIALPNDPARIMLNPVSRQALLAFADYHDGGNREIAQMWDLDSGNAVGQQLELGLEKRLRFSPDGHALLAWNDESLQLLDTATGQPRWALIALTDLAAAASGQTTWPEDGPDVDVYDVRFSADGRRLDALTHTNPGDSTVYWQFDAATGRELRREARAGIGGGGSFIAMPDGDARVLQRWDANPLWWDANGVRELPVPAYTWAAALALAPDARMFALASADSVTLTAARSLQWLAPPLPAALAHMSTFNVHPTQLAFTRDGENLIARSRDDWWLRWNIAPDVRPVDQLLREAALLSPDQSSPWGGLSSPLPQAQRQAMRAQDSGPPHAVAAAPSVESLSARNPGTAANLVDLGRYYNKALVSAVSGPGYVEDFLQLPPGTHRLLGVDYDIRGSIDLSTRGFEAAAGAPPSRIGIDPGVRRFAALDVLVNGRSMLISGETRPYAIVEIDYRDGSRDRLPILYHRDVNESTSWRNAKAGETWARIAWRSRNSYGSPRNRVPPRSIFAVHLANPHPEREVASLALEAGDEAWSSPSFFAITAQPLDDRDPPLPPTQHRERRK